MLNSVKKYYICFISYFKKRVISASNTKKRNKKKFRKILNSLNLEDRFTQIYHINYWNSNESASGVGSTLKATEKLRVQLPLIFKRFSIESVFDGPCGDFNWMKLVVKETDITYCGGDIVLPLIEKNQSEYGNEKVRFMHIDLTKNAPPSADLMICRDCLFHLSYEDTKLVLSNYIKSNIPFLLTTTYKNHNEFKNQNIVTGHFRFIDLFSPPYNFSRDVLFQVDDWVGTETPRYLCLWSREQIIKAFQDF